MDLPAKIGPDEVAQLNLILPGQFTLSQHQHVLHLTLHSPAPAKRPLVTFEIAPFKQRSFEGSLLPELLEALADGVLAKYRAMGETSENMENKILKTLNDPVGMAMERHIRNNEFRIRILKIHTAEESAWYG